VTEFNKHVRSGALQLVPSEDRNSTLCLPLFAIQQEEKLRLIYDARFLNAALSDPSFEMETVFDIPSIASGMHFIGKLDLTQAYCQYPVSAELSAQLGCIGPDLKIYSWSVLPFGLSHSPKVFCSLTSAFVRRWRSMGIRCLAYVDDIIFFAESPEAFVRAAEIILSDLRAARIAVSPKKTFISPFRRLDALGLRVDLASQSFSVPPAKIAKITNLANTILANKSCIRRTLLSLIGRLGFASVACPYVIFFRAGLLGNLQNGSDDLDETLYMTDTATSELSFWSSTDSSRMLSTTWPWKRFSSHRVFAQHASPRDPPTFTVWGDASETGAGYNSSSQLGLPASELLPPEYSGNRIPSIVRELWVMVRLVEMSKLPRGACVRLISDNMGAVSTANGSAVCASTAPLAQRLVRALTARDIILQVEWAPREQLDDVDQRSRSDAHNLSHCMCANDDYIAMFGWAYGTGLLPDVQLFACAGSTIPNTAFCSRFPEPNSLGCPFLFNWRKGKRIWAFPPFSLARPFLKRLLAEAYEQCEKKNGLQLCALLPLNANVRAAISALPPGWRTAPGPSRLLAPPAFDVLIRPTTALILIASPTRTFSAPSEAGCFNAQGPEKSLWDGAWTS
jgi:hypothetical protein